ncbi:TonB-dependent receptor [Occallatibacter riparius]|uniref:Carboxypeptidase regulatory-like domain-containing protein n=1 Tax=Occallatibacter riparius TaxID=1002689 RepID=A0A9J7BTB5_9BACT|nr:TonB-dependent receptor [Occallatibacter riparius]UWZ85833.1 carboxypeptidase regulatory-like domain-containing protein [Occallatibacter riparius]
MERYYTLRECLKWRRRDALSWLGCLLALLIPAMALHAQEFRGTITGQVTDEKSAVLQGATVIAVGPQQTYKAETTAKGDFTIPLVQPGTYSISAEVQGFKKTEQQGLVIDVSSKVNVNLVLAVGTVSETVTVTAESATVNTVDASGGTVIAPEQVQSLPMNGRQMYTLLSLTPGVKGSDPGTQASGLNESNGYSINGNWGNYNQFSLNGAPVSQQNGGGSGTWNISPSVDAVEEFKVMTNTYDAQYGRTNGGTVNTILKSGTSQYHGTAFDYWRNAVLDTNRFDLKQAGVPKQAHNLHQFGGTVGGPVPGLRKNTFFFFSWESWREARPGSVTENTITSDMLPGSDGSVDLSNYLAAIGATNGIYDPLTTYCVTEGSNGCSKWARQQFPGNVIPANRIDPVGVALLKLLPKATRSGYLNNYVVGNPGHYSYNQPIGRLDHNFSDKTRAYGMIAVYSSKSLQSGNAFPGAAAFNSNGYNNTQYTISPVVDVTHTFRNNLFMDVRASYNRMNNESPDGAEAAGLANVTAASIGLTMPAIPTTHNNYLPEIHADDGILPNFVGNVVNPSIFETYNIAPSLTHVIGRSTLHYGGEYNWYHDIANGVRRPNGGFNFGPGFTQKDPYQNSADGSTIAGFLLGYPSWGGVEYNDPTYESYKDYALFIQDDWKVNHRLALNVGLRYENETSPMDRWGRLQAGICLTCTNPISGTLPTVTMPNGTTFPSTIMAGLKFQTDRTPYENTWGILLPKFGATFSLTNNLVVRGGWGLYRALGFELGGTSTWDANTGYNTSFDNGRTPNPAFRTGTPFTDGYITPPGDSKGLASGDGDGIWEDSWNRKIPYTQQFSFGLQGGLRGGIVWDVEYVGARTFDLRAGMQRNHLTPTEFAQGMADSSYLDTLMPNPFQGNALIPSATYLGSHSQVSVKEMMVPYPQYDSVWGPELWEWNTPQGYSHYDSLVGKAEKRFSNGSWLSNGLSFTTAFTWSKVISATSRLNNGWLTDPEPTYEIDGSDRPFLFSFGGVYKLPVGRGGVVARDAHGILGGALNDWQLNFIVQDQSGQPVSFPNNWNYTCGSFDIRPAHKSWGSYLNNSQPNCFHGFPEYEAITLKDRTSAVRTPWAPQEQLGLQKGFQLLEKTSLQFRAEAFNLTNTPIFNGPNTGGPNTPVIRQANIPANLPGAYTGYGTVGPSIQNEPREIQLSLKILF